MNLSPTPFLNVSNDVQIFKCLKKDFALKFDDRKRLRVFQRRHRMNAHLLRENNKALAFDL